MLFDESLQLVKEVPAEAREVLKKKFPSFYEGKKPVCLHVRKSMWRKEILVRDDQKNDPNAATKQSPFRPPIDPTSHKANFEYEGRKYSYSSTSPRVDRAGNRRLTYPGAVIRLSHDTYIQPNEEDKLFAIYFGLGIVKDSPKAKENYIYEVYDPADEAASKIASFKREESIKRFIYSEASAEVVRTTLETLGFTKFVNDDQNRVHLYDKYSFASEVIKERILSLVGYGKEGTKKVETTESATSLVNRLVETKMIKFENGGWYGRDKRGSGENFKTKPFFETTKTGAEAHLELIELVEKDSELFNQLSK